MSASPANSSPEISVFSGDSIYEQYRAVHVKNIDMQKMRTLLTNRKLLKRKLIDVENHVRGALRA